MGSKSSDVVAGGASVRVGGDDSPFRGMLTSAEKRLKAFGANAMSIGAQLSGLGIGLAVGLVGAAKSFADTGSMLDDMAQRTGDTAENLSAIGYAAQMSGSSIETLEGGLSKMSGTIAGAIAGEKTAVKLLSDLGLKASDLNGKLPTDQLQIFAEKISQISNNDTKIDMVKAIFGKSGTQLIPLLNSGADGIEELRKEAERLGLVMSTEDAQAAASFGDALDNLTGSAGSIITKIGGALAPALTGIANYLTDAVASISKFIGENKALVSGIGVATVAVIAAGAAIVGIGAVSYVAGAGLAALSAVIGGAYTIACGIATTATSLLAGSIAVLGSPLALAVGLVAALGAGVLALGGGFDSFGETVSSVMSSSMGLLDGLLSTAQTTFGGIADAISSGNIQGAIDILWAGVKLAWQQGSDGIKGAWDATMIYLSGAMDSMYMGVTKIWSALSTAWVIVTTGIEGAWDTLSTNMQGGWVTVINGIKGGIDSFLTAISNAFAEVLLKIREARVAMAIFLSASAKTAAYANIEVDRKAGKAKSDKEFKARADARQKEIDAAFDKTGLEQRRQERNNRIAASGDTSQQDAAFKERQAARQSQLNNIGKPSEEVIKLQDELAALVEQTAIAAEWARANAANDLQNGADVTASANQAATDMKSPAAAARGSAEAASTIIRSMGAQRNPNAGLEAKADKQIGLLKKIAENSGIDVEEVAL